MQQRMAWLAHLPKVLLGIYPLVIFAACRQEVAADGIFGLLIFLFALSLPLYLLLRSLVTVFLREWSRWSKVILISLILIALGALLFQYVSQWKAHYRWLFLVQDLAFVSVMTYMFANTLSAGKEPLCSFLARLVHKRMSPALMRYTRQVTVLWTAFFITCGIVSVMLFSFSSATVWAFFTNLMVPLLAVALFLVEYLCRRYFLPPEDRVSVRQTIRAFRLGLPNVGNVGN